MRCVASRIYRRESVIEKTLKDLGYEKSVSLNNHGLWRSKDGGQRLFFLNHKLNTMLAIVREF